MLKFMSRVILIYFSLLPFSFASTLPKVLSLKDLSDLKQVVSAKISPDGQHIAYIQSNPRKLFVDDDGLAWREMYVSNQNGEIRPLIVGEEAIGDLQWATNSQYIWFLAKRPKDAFVGIYIIALKDGEARKIVTHSDHISGFSVSEDHKKLVYWGKDAFPPEQDQLIKKGFNARVFEEDEAIDKLWFVDLSKLDKKILLIPNSGHVVDAQFHPNNKHLLLQSAPSALVDDVIMKKKISLIDLNGAIINEINHVGKMGKMQLSPDGKYVAVIGSNDLSDPSEGRLLVGRSKQSHLQNILPDFDGHVRDITWLSKRNIAFIGHQGTGSILASKPVTDISANYQVINKNSDIHSALSSARGGKNLAVIAHAPKHPKELFWFKDESIERITDSNPWLHERQFATQQEVIFSARDGQKIDGILLLPLSPASVPAPLLIFVHGGPESHISNGWLSRYSQPVHYAAAQGYASFLPNYRGSTGRGVEFSKLGQADYAGAEFTDLLDAKQHLVNQGIALDDKTGMIGSSYGGYAAAWGATALSKHFAANVMAMGISNQISKFGTTDIPHEMYLQHALKWPWEDWRWMLERSPVFYVQNSRTPLLIMHGENDTRVNPGQSMELYRALKTLNNAPVRLIMYPNEGHGIEKAAARLDFSMRMMRWMDNFLLQGNTSAPAYQLDHHLHLPLNTSATDTSSVKEIK
ncbi:MAG: dipeptidyl aminopeptidase/acylaminoacyl peptidase [Paraglaciecola sp.]|jgi:dipeptidyl aminopeptidase/acylaminoacyl peptidase